MKNSKLLLATAFAGLALSSCAETPKKSMDQSGAETVMCHGVNSCKGHGQCGGKVDACSGANGCDATISCAGKNSCKGKGLKKMSKKECLDKGGKVAKS